ncbi:MAG TPA: SRPBCC family protein [Kofleriaceae bacterium]|jgi:uncharacterized protein YndB with AHSA1/START domain
MKSQFVYVTFIRTTPEKLWKALTDKAFIRQYWFGMTIESDWTQGSSWRMQDAEGTLYDDGEIVEIEAPKRIVIRWTHRWRAELTAEGPSRCTMELEPVENAMKLTITHEIERPESKLISAVASGWPLICSNLKSLLETGEIAVTKNQRH